MIRNISYVLAGFLLIVYPVFVFSQGVVISANGAAIPEPSAMLDVESTGKGFLPPRMTTTQRNAIPGPAAGLVVYDTQVESLFIFDGSVWGALATGTGSKWIQNGNNIYRSTGNVGIGTNTPSATLHTIETIGGNGNVLFEGSFKGSGAGITPAEGQGTRMLWYPDKAAFRAGRVSGSQWNISGIGNYSSGFGFDAMATGDYSVAMGSSTEATGAYSFASGLYSIATGVGSTAMGTNTIADGFRSTAFGNETFAFGDFSTAFGFSASALGNNSTAMGYQSTALGNTSMAWGFETTGSGNYSTSWGLQTDAIGFGSTSWGNNSKAPGNYATSMGTSTTAAALNSVALGRFNVGNGNASTWENADPLFEIGIGTSSLDKKNAFTVLKNGRIGIGTAAPLSMVVVAEHEGSVGMHLLGNDNYFRSNSWEFGSAGSYPSIGVLTGDFVLKSPSTFHYVFWTTYFKPVSDNTVTLGTSAYRWNTVYAANGTINTSDEREKTNISDTRYGLKEVMQLRPVSYEWIDRPAEGQKLGFLAQDLLEVIPEVVATKEKVVDRETGAAHYVDAERLGVYYADIIPVLVKAIQELELKVESQRAEIRELKNQSGVH
jgi:hypothetical protein